MAERSKRLAVSFTSDAIRSLDQIWRWNAAERGPAHADRYIGFLAAQAQKLAVDRTGARQVLGHPNLFYCLLRRRGSRGHAHIIVFGIEGEEMIVADFHHTAQDWERRYEADEEA